MEIVDRFTKLENGKVRYSITGEASDNLVVLMHGLTTSKDIYNDMTFDLTSKGFQVLSFDFYGSCLLYTSPSPRDATLSRMPSSA